MPEALADEVVTQRLNQLEGWRLEHNKLVKEISFAGFSAAFGFVCRVALLSETQNHHPNVCHSYATVRIETWSHDANGVTERDLKLAKAVNAL